MDWNPDPDPVVSLQRERVRDAVTDIIRYDPLYARIIVSLKIEEDNDSETSVWCDGVTLGWNPHKDHTQNEWARLIERAVCGVAMLHNWRRGYRDNAQWNKACLLSASAVAAQNNTPWNKNGDYLKDSHFRKIKDEYFSKDSSIEVGNRPVEDLYETIRERDEEKEKEKNQQNQQENQQNDGNGGQNGPPQGLPPPDIEFRDAPPQSGGDTQKQRVLAAAEKRQHELEKMMGNDDGEKGDENGVIDHRPSGMGYSRSGLATGILKLCGVTTSPHRGWKEIMKCFFDKWSKEGVDWSTPNKRHAWRGMYLPSKRSRGDITNLVVAIDISGSVSEEKLNRFTNEVGNIIKELGGKVKVKPILVNTRVREMPECSFENVDSYDWTIPAGGGTNLQVGFDWVEECMLKKGERVSGMVFFTDLEDYRIQDIPKPPYRTLWVAFGDDSAARKPTFGEIVGFDQ